MNEQPIHDPEARELVEKIEDYEGIVPEGLTDLFANAPAVIRRLDARVAFLEKALKQAMDTTGLELSGMIGNAVIHNAYDQLETTGMDTIPELAEYLKEQAAKEKE